MNLKQYLITMILGSILCWVSWFFVLFNVDPFQSSNLGFIFFYISLFFSLIGTISLLIFFLYHQFGSKDIPMFKHVQLSFRQSTLFSFFVVLFLYFQGKHLLNFWNSMIFLTFFILILSFNISIKRINNQ